MKEIEAWILDRRLLRCGAELDHKSMRDFTVPDDVTKLESAERWSRQCPQVGTMHSLDLCGQKPVIEQEFWRNRGIPVMGPALHIIEAPKRIDGVDREPGGEAIASGV
jgi:hypothetical protein